jgi:heme/copper-type cytochrome/quinol oxidase subunit 4
MTRNRSVGAALFVLTLIPIAIVSYYRVGDWIGGPLLILYLLIPLSIVQFVFMLLFFMKKEKAKGLVGLQAAIMLVSNALMFYYIRAH